MKKFDTLKTLTRTMQSFVAMMLVTLMAVGSVVAQTTYSHTITVKTWSALGEQSLNGVNWTATGTATDGGYFGYDNTKGQQFGSGSKPFSALTLTTSEIAGTITSVKVNTSGANSVNATFKVKVGDTYFTSGEADHIAVTNTATDYTFTGSASGAVALEWAQTSSKALYIKSIEVTYTPAGVAVAAPTFAPGAGLYYTAQNVAISCETADAIIHYTLDGTAPTAQSPIYSTPIAVNTTTTIKAIAVKGTDSSTVASATYTFPIEVASIAAFKAANTATNSTVYKITGDVTFVFKNGANIYVQDTTGGLLIYDQGTSVITRTYTEGDVISGGVYGSCTLYNGLVELIPTRDLAASTINTGAVAPIVATVADIKANYAQFESKLVTISDVTFAGGSFNTSSATNINVEQDGETMQVRNVYKTLSMTIPAGFKANVTGFVLRYNNNFQLAPRANEDVQFGAVTLPYMVDFDQNVDPGFVIANGNYTDKWYIGQAQGFDNNKLYISSNNGVTNKYDVNAYSDVLAYRDVIIPENGAVLNFDSRTMGENGDVLVVYIYNYSADEYYTIFWEYDEPEWNHINMPISPEYAGLGQLVFRWVNNGNGQGEQFPIAIDNISLTEAVCAQPIALNVTVNDANAVVTWTAADTTQNAWTLEYKLEDHNEWYSVNTTTPTATLTDLQGSSNYNVRVKANCGSESSEWTYANFAVGCVNGTITEETLTFGNETSTPNNMLPFAGYYYHSYTQQLITEEELAEQGIIPGSTINQIGFDYYYATSTVRPIMIGMANTTEVSFGNSFISNNEFTTVYASECQEFSNENNNWVMMTLSTPFTYTGGTLAISMLMDYTTNSSCFTQYDGTYRFYQSNVGSNVSRVFYCDGSSTGNNITFNANGQPTSTYSYTYTNNYAYRNNIRFNVTVNNCNDQLACAAPTAVTVTDVTENSAVITWSGNATNYSFEYKTGNDDWTVVPVSDTTYTLTGLTQKTEYLVRVKAICGENNNSLYTEEIPFATLSICPIVTNIETSNLSTTTSISWTPGSNENEWNLRFRPVGSNEWVNLHISGIASTTFGGLQDQTDYEVEIMALCDPTDEDNQSSWAHYEFTSGCAPFELPFEEGFASTTRPDCWESNGIIFNGTVAVADSAAEWLMTPPVQIPGDNKTYIVVDMQGTASLMASYRGTQMNRFTEIAMLGNDETGHYIIEIPASLKDKAVNFMFLASENFSIDNVEFTQCAFVPVNLTAANPLNNAVELTWNGINNNGWVVEYAKTGTDSWTSVFIDQTTDTVTYTLTGLEGSTSYKFRVRTTCAGGFTSKPSNEATATTRCDAVAVPYEDFDGITSTLDCWTPFFTGTSNLSYVDETWAGKLQMYNYYNRTLDSTDNTALGDLYAILPTMDTALNALQINFTAETYFSSDPDVVFQLGVVTDINRPAQTFRQLGTDYTAVYTPANYTYILNNVDYAGNLAFRVKKSNETKDLRLSNIKVENIPACQKPRNLVAVPLTENSMELRWNKIGNQPRWEIKYMKVYSEYSDFDPDNSGTLATANSSPRIFNNLEYGAWYVFYMRTKCGEGEYSDGWVGPIRKQLLIDYNIANTPNVTSCNGNVVFEDTTSAAATYTMVINPGNADSWIELTGNINLGTGNNLYVYDGTAVDETKILAAFRSESGNIGMVMPFCEHALTLRLEKSANSNPVLDIQINCGDVPTCSAPMNVAYNELTNTLTWDAGCWGTPESYSIPLQDAQGNIVLSLTSTTTSVVIPVENLSNGTYIAMVFPICNGQEGTGVWTEFDRVACADPTNFTANITGTTAQLTWSGNAALGYEVGYKLHGAYTWNTDNVTTTSYTITGLDDDVDYDFRVRAICNASDQSAYVTTTGHVNCITTQAVAEDVVTGTGTSTTSYFPSYTYYKYSLTEQIYLSDELGDAGEITSVSFQTTNTTTRNRDLEVYIVATNKATFTSTSDWIRPTAEDLVFSGRISTSAPTSNGWFTINLDRPFVYNGDDNIVLIVDDNTGTGSSSTSVTYTTTSPNYRAMYKYDNTNNLDPTSITVSASSRSYNRNNVRFHFENRIVCDPVVSCPAPSNVAIAGCNQTSVTINWDKGGNETEWMVVYTLGNNDPVSATATDTFYTINNLDASTTYTLDFSVYANCDATHQSAGDSKVFTFTTPCPAQSVPYEENFNDYTTSATSSSAPSGYPNHTMPSCWSFLNMSQTTGTYPQIFLSSNSSYATSGNCLFFKSSSTTPAYAILPEFTEDLSSLQMTFKYRNESTGTYNGTLHVGYMTNINDPSSFVDLKTCAQITSLTEVTVSFANVPASTGNPYHIAFKYQGGSSNNYYLSIEDVVVDMVPTCGTPDVAVSGFSATITPSTSSLNTPVAYELTIGNETQIVNATNNNVDLSTLFTLQPQTNYSLTVKSICGVGDTSAENTVSFTTPCMALSLPYTENFEGTVFPPDCWSQSYVSGTHDWTRQTSSSYGSGTYDAGFTHTTSGTKTRLLTPQFDLSAYHTVQIKFKHSQAVWSGDQDELRVYYRPSAASNWVQLAEYTESITTMRQEQIILPAAALTATCQFAFEAYDSYGHGVFVDDFVVEEIPTCSAPEVSSFNIAFNPDPTLTWSPGSVGTPEGYTLQYRENGTETFTEVTTQTASYTFTGLTEGTTYQVRVKQDCGATDGQSTWTPWLSFRVPYTCLSQYELPFFEDFEENSTTRGCWLVSDVDHDGYNWTFFVNSNYTHSGDYCMASPSYDDNYGALNSDNWLISPAIHISAPAQLSFWASSVDPSYLDHFSVYVDTTINGLLTATPLLSNIEAPYTYTEYAVDLDAYLNKTIYIAFRHADEDEYWLLLDDIAITTHSSCSAPMGLAFENDTLNWNNGIYGTPASYNVRYRLQGDTVWTEAVAATNFFTPVRWESNSDYEAQVQTNCGNDDLSEWSDILQFHTPVTCFTPTELTVTDVTDRGATITWNDSHNQTNYAVEYKAEGETAWTTVAVASTRTLTLTNLNYLTTYTVRMKAVCSEYDESEYTDEVEFTTLCAGGYKEDTEVDIITSSTTDSYLPFHGLYEYSYSQQIFDANELNLGTADIKSISFKCTTAPSFDKTGGIHIWLGQTNKSSFSSTADYVDVNTLTEVFAMPATQSYTFTAGEWSTFTFDTPFHYDGTSNLVVAFYEGKASWSSSAFAAHNTSDYKAIYLYSDDETKVSYTDPASATGTKDILQKRNDIILEAVINYCPPDNDLAIESIEPIADACDLSDAKVVVKLKNNSYLNNVNGFSVSYTVNGAETPVTETVNATILPLETYVHTFAATPLFIDGSNDIVVNVVYENDEVEDNNTIALYDIRQVVPATVPYEQDFSNVVLGRDAWTQGAENNNPNLWTNNNGVLTFVDSDTIDAQNYVISHCIEIPAGQMQVSYDYNALSNMPENMNVYMGTTPDIASMTLIGSHTNFTKTVDGHTYNYLFNNANAGIYYFAIEATSVKGNMGVTFDNLAIMPMIDVNVIAGPNGTVTPNGTVKVPYNGDLTINIIPNDMYHTAGVWVDSVRVMNEDPYNASFMMYTLENITEPHTIEVRFKMEFHINKYAYNYSDQYAEVGGRFEPAEADTLLDPSGHVLTMIADEHYSLHSLVVGIIPPASEGAIIDGDNVIANVTYDEATRTYTYTFDTLYVSNYYVQACFKKDTVAINYATLTGIGVYDGVSVAAGETHNTWVDYGSDFTSTIQPADGYYNMGVTVNGVDKGIIDHYDFDSLITTQYVTAQFGHKVTASIMNYNNNEYLGSDEVRGTIEPADTMILSGSSCTVTGTVQEHFHLSNFFVNGEDKLADVNVNGLGFTYTIDSLVANTDIVAVVRIDTIAIYYTVNGGNGYVNGNLMEAPATDTIYVEYGSDFMSRFAAATGYHIVNVTVNGTVYGEIPSWLTEYITAPQNIAATFALNEYDITTAAHGNGSVTPGMHVVYDPQSSYTFTATPAEGYHISQILRNNENLVIADPEAAFTDVIAPVLNDYSYVAYFEPNIYTVTASCGANGTIDPYGAQNYEYGMTPTFTVTANAGYAIEHVYVDGEEVTLTNGTYTFAALTANHTISATFTEDTHTITATAGNGGSIDPDGANVVMTGSTVVYTITPATGYDIADVTVDNVSVGAVATYTFENVTADHAIAATFSAQQFTITATAGANGTITPSGVQTVAYGATPTFTVTADAGYEIDEVRVDGQVVTLTNGAYTFAAVAADHEIFAAFKVKSYTITVTDPNNGTITPNGVITVNHGATPTFTVTPATGYDVTAITVNGSNVIADAQATVMGAYTYTFPAVTANRTLTATMTKKHFTITATAGANGTINGPATVEYGDNATYTITPTTGYEIANVTVDGMSVGAVATYTFHNVTANHTINATFRVEPCVVPTNLQTINIDSTSAMLTWYHPGADSYDIQYRPANATTWTVVSNVPGFSYSLTNLQTSTTYVWRIKANTLGCTDADWSNATSFTTLAGPTPGVGVADYVKNHVNVYAEHNRVHIVNDYNVDIDNVSIYDMYGKLIYSGNAINNPEVIELNVAVGTYVVRLNTQQGPAVYKVHINR